MALLCVSTRSLAQAPILREPPSAGAIVAAKGGEELRLPRQARWHPALVKQDVLAGDTLRTGDIGTLGILFADQTTIRVARQSTLVVNHIARDQQPTELSLGAGSIWARASRGGSSVTVKTPAASAAIRGTDWSLSVVGDRTSLVVLEGIVDFTNPQGSVRVRQGESASARIGEAPTKTVLVRPKDREQMLFYLDLRNLFRVLPATPLEGANLDETRRRIMARPADARSAEDWLTMAEIAVSRDGVKPAELALAQARRLPLTRGQAARARLVEGLLAGARRDFKVSSQLLRAALPALEGRRHAIGRCALEAAAVMADPKRPVQTIRGDDPDTVTCNAYFAGFKGTISDSAQIIQAAGRERRINQLSLLLEAQVALLLDRRDALRDVVARMEAQDPEAPETLLASGYLKSSIDSDHDAAVRIFRRGVERAPGNSDMWNGLGLAQSARDASQEAEAAFRQAIAADPEDPVAYANLAILLLDQSRIEEASRLVDKALALNPSFYAAYVARGRVLLQSGRDEEAVKSLLAGAAADPAYAQGLLALAIAHYESGDLIAAQQSLDNADRLDPNDPVTSIAQTAIALDQYQADAAIVHARESMRRYRNRGGDFAALSATRTGGSYLGQAYRFLGLEDWARFYTERVADPFTASSSFDQAVARRHTPIFARPSVERIEAGDGTSASANLALQGLFLDPLAVASRIGRLDLLRRPFLDTEVAVGVQRRDGQVGWRQEANVQAFVNSPVPTSVALSASQTRTQGRGQLPGGVESRTASAFIGMAPDASHRILLWGTLGVAEPNLLTPNLALFDQDWTRLRSFQLGAGYSQTISHQNVITTALVAERGDQQQRRAETQLLPGPVLVDTRIQRRAVADSLTATVGHMMRAGDIVFRSGLEGQVGRARTVDEASITVTSPLGGGTVANVDRDSTGFRTGRIYTHALWQPNDRVQLDAGVTATGFETAGAARTHLLPRVGVAVSPVPSHWLRAMWRQDVETPASFTLAPVTTVALLPYALPAALGARSETLAARWDAEWSERFFTAVEYQHQTISRLQVGVPDTLDSFDLGRSRVETITAAANLWLTHGLGVTGMVGAARTRTVDAAGTSGEVPFVPGLFARASLVYVHPSRVRLSLHQNLYGERQDTPSGGRLPAFTTTDLAASWETSNRRLQVELAILNIFDRQYDLMAARPGRDAIPGSGRTISGLIRARF